MNLDQPYSPIRRHIYAAQPQRALIKAGEEPQAVALDPKNPDNLTVSGTEHVFVASLRGVVEASRNPSVEHTPAETLPPKKSAAKTKIKDDAEHALEAAKEETTTAKDDVDDWGLDT